MLCVYKVIMLSILSTFVNYSSGVVSKIILLRFVHGLELEIHLRFGYWVQEPIAINQLISERLKQISMVCEEKR